MVVVVRKAKARLGYDHPDVRDNVSRDQAHAKADDWIRGSSEHPALNDVQGPEGPILKALRRLFRTLHA